jgi:hypothetical protein
VFTRFPARSSMPHLHVTTKTARRRNRPTSRRHFKSSCKLKGMKGYHHYLLAEAQIAAAEKSGPYIPKKYNQAISTALETGYKHDAALVAHLAAGYFLNMSDDSLMSTPLRQARDNLVRENLDQARDLYLQWGAKGVVLHLETEYKTYLPPTVGLFDEQSTSGGSCAITFASMADDANYGMGSVVLLPKSIATNDDDVSVLTGLTGATGFTGLASRKSVATLNPHTGDVGFSPIHEDDGISPSDATGW